MAQMMMTNAKRDLWTVKADNGKVLCRNRSLAVAEAIMRKQQLAEDWERLGGDWNKVYGSEGAQS